jgi:translation initiation factor SUI1
MENESIDTNLDLDKKPLIVHIKLQQRNRKKCITFIEGLNQIQQENKDKFFDSITKSFKTKFNCGVSLKKPDYIVQLSGDHRKEIKEFLISKKILKDEQIKIHGY